MLKESMANTKDIRRRIKSIKSTRQITKAMELVAAAKMRKAQAQAQATRTYARLAWELVNNLTKTTDPSMHRLLDPRLEVKKIGLIVVSSNRGLAGSFNAQIFNTMNKYLKDEAVEPPSPDEGRGWRKGQIDVEFVTVGKKVRDSLRKRGGNIAADFEKIDFNLREQDILPLANLAISDFISGKYDRIVIGYMHFYTTLNQKPIVKQILPIQGFAGENSPFTPSLSKEGEGGVQRIEYLFEPTPDIVLESVLPHLIQMQIYQAILETNASEHSARMVAMKNASDAAGDLVSELTLEYNQLRQAAITKEISEIVAGQN